MSITCFADNKTVVSGSASDIPDVATTYVGRTPCSEISSDIGLNPPAECFKLKWKLILYRDAKTLKPTTYLLQSTFNRQKDITGTWSGETIRNNNIEQPMYSLHNVLNGKNLTLLVGDENVLFFVDPTGNLYPGNAEFSYTLNRK
ncbi:hypothetical protein [Pollutibacter soli]|uniref:hypothetical protein n=1 Tax=Pollutibacter soli TaxID=3034157 RepID=UPI003013F41E